MKQLEEKIGYSFKNKSYLQTALTHSSYANEQREPEYNERLEFLGDAVLSLVVSNYLFKNYTTEKEGTLSKMRASLVCEKALCRYSTSLGIGEYILLGHGELSSGGRTRPSILADVFEAIIAAIYLDSGISQAEKFILSFIIPELSRPLQPAFKDYKTILQEIIQQNNEEELTYNLVSETGPDHDKHFVVEVRLNSNVVGKGGGRSKKEAEQRAACEALKLLGY